MFSPANTTCCQLLVYYHIRLNFTMGGWCDDTIDHIRNRHFKPLIDETPVDGFYLPDLPPQSVSSSNSTQQTISNDAMKLKESSVSLR